MPQFNMINEEITNSMKNEEIKTSRNSTNYMSLSINANTVDGFNRLCEAVLEHLLEYNLCYIEEYGIILQYIDGNRFEMYMTDFYNAKNLLNVINLCKYLCDLLKQKGKIEYNMFDIYVICSDSHVNIVDARKVGLKVCLGATYEMFPLSNQRYIDCVDMIVNDLEYSVENIEPITILINYLFPFELSTSVVKNGHINYELHFVVNMVYDIIVDDTYLRFFFPMVFAAIKRFNNKCKDNKYIDFTLTVNEYLPRKLCPAVTVQDVLNEMKKSRYLSNMLEVVFNGFTMLRRSGLIKNMNRGNFFLSWQTKKNISLTNINKSNLINIQGLGWMHFCLHFNNVVSRFFVIRNSCFLYANYIGEGISFTIKKFIKFAIDNNITIKKICVITLFSKFGLYKDIDGFKMWLENNLESPNLEIHAMQLSDFRESDKKNYSSKHIYISCDLSWFNEAYYNISDRLYKDLMVNGVLKLSIFEFQKTDDVVTISVAMEKIMYDGYSSLFLKLIDYIYQNLKITKCRVCIIGSLSLINNEYSVIQKYNLCRYIINDMCEYSVEWTGQIPNYKFNPYTPKDVVSNDLKNQNVSIQNNMVSEKVDLLLENTINPADDLIKNNDGWFINIDKDIYMDDKSSRIPKVDTISGNWFINNINDHYIEDKEIDNDSLSESINGTPEKLIVLNNVVENEDYKTIDREDQEFELKAYELELIEDYKIIDREVELDDYELELIKKCSPRKMVKEE